MADDSEGTSSALAPPGWAEGGSPSNPASQVAADEKHARAECAENTLLLFRVRGSGEQPGGDKLGAWTFAAGKAAIAKGWRVRDMQADYPAPSLPMVELAVAAALAGNPVALTRAINKLKGFRDVASRNWEKVRDQLAAAYERCHARKVLVAGYSYGGIMLRYVVRSLKPEVREQIVRIDLVSDPTAQGSIDEDMIHSGGLDERKTSQGLDTWAARKPNPFFKQSHYPDDVVRRTAQYCVPYDAVCEANPVNFAAFAAGKYTVHTNYRWAAIGRQAAERLRPWGSTSPSVSTYRLRPRAFPRFLTFSSDGSLWITESGDDSGPVGYGIIERLRPNGRLTQYRIPGSSSTGGNIVQGPDGAMWFCGLLVIGRIDQVTGAVTGWETARWRDVGLPTAITSGPGRAIWYTNEGVPASITRITTSGAITKFVVPSGSGGLDMPDVTTGPDGALWFTQSSVGSGPPDAIGRMSASGRYQRWALPTQDSMPAHITAGPDGALWFTERTAFRIGRITTEGRITEFGLPHLAPVDITAGRDGALWFTTDKRIGRITTAGKATTWRVPGAKRLGGIAAAPDGSFWITDGQADALRRFVPPR